MQSTFLARATTPIFVPLLALILKKNFFSWALNFALIWSDNGLCYLNDHRPDIRWCDMPVNEFACWLVNRWNKPAISSEFVRGIEVSEITISARIVHAETNSIPGMDRAIFISSFLMAIWFEILASIYAIFLVMASIISRWARRSEICDGDKL